MQFKHPELLYALLLLLIPIIVHLFQLRRFKEIPFTNVAFLKQVTLQTRKSSQLKKWLTLLTRLILLAFAILAFAQPFTSKTNTFNREKETVVYLDNSFSMQAKGSQGELLKRALQDLISNIPEDEEFTLITNTETYRNTTIKAIKNELLETPYSSSQLAYDALQLKGKKLFKGDNTLKNLIIISDFQNKGKAFNYIQDSTINTHLVQLKPLNTNNIYIDSAYVSKENTSSLLINVDLKNTGEAIENLPVSLYNDESLLAKTALSIDNKGQAQFSLPTNQNINGRIVINDVQLQFDNTLVFNINTPEKIKVLSISNTDNTFLERIYTDDEFEFSSATPERLNYSTIEFQNTIVLNELKAIPNALITALQSFTSNGGILVVIPSNESSLSSYNQLFTNYNLARFSKQEKLEKRITTINYSHPLYSGVFDKKISNFQYPKVDRFYPVNKNSGASILEYEDGKSFLQKNGNTYIFSSALNVNNSNFKNSPLIVPTFYKIAKQSLKLPDLYYTIGNTNSYDVSTKVQQDQILKLVKQDISIIPQQQPYASKVNISTVDEPSQTGIYSIMNNDASVKNVSYNYSRDESNLTYTSFSDETAGLQTESITELFDALKSNNKINELWKWFIIFALLFLIIEMLILKYMK